MEKQDLNNILIKDTEFYIKYCTYVETLKRHNIITVGQLLSQENMNIKFRGSSKIELYALIDMLKYRYLGIPLPYGHLLDNKIDMNALMRGSYMYSLPLLTPQNDSINLSLCRMLCICNSSDFVIHSFVKSINETKTPEDTYENLKLIDFLTWIIDSYEYGKSFKPYAKAYIEEYYRYDTKRLANLKEKLEKLIEERQKLDAAIEHIQEQIDEVLNIDQQNNVKGYTYHKD